MNPSQIPSRTPAALLISLVLVILSSAVFPQSALAVSEADEACRDWYEKQAPEEQVREDNEAQISNDVDGDGCTGMLAPPGSNGPVEKAKEKGGVEPRDDQPHEGSAGEGKESDEKAEDCATKFEKDDAEERAREREQDQSFGVDEDGDGCIAGDPVDDASKPGGAPADTPPEESAGMQPADEGGGGFGGMVLGSFWDIMESIWDKTFGWALENMAESFKANVLSLPSLEGNTDLIGFYKGGVEKLRPGILVGILVLGILMMVRSDNYDLAYAGFQGLPKLIGVAVAMAVLPQFMGTLSGITGGLTKAFFPGGQDINSAGFELFKAASMPGVANFLVGILMVALVWVGVLVIIVALLKNILFVVLFVAGPFALIASLVPGFSSLAGSWFRGIVACAAIPALWSIELGIGTFVVKSPEAIFGEQANILGFVSNNVVTNIGAILILWVMYKTPFKVIEWAFNTTIPGRGGLAGLTKAVAIAAATTPVRQAIAGKMAGRAAGGAATTKTVGDTGKISVSKNPQSGNVSVPKRIQQLQSQGHRSRATHNAVKSVGDDVKATNKFLSQGQKNAVPTRRRAGFTGRNDRKSGMGDGSGQRKGERAG